MVSSRVSDLITRLRDVAGKFDDVKIEFEALGKEFEIQAQNGRVTVGDGGSLAAHGHGDITIGDLQACLQAGAGIMAALRENEDYGTAIILVRR